MRRADVVAAVAGTDETNLAATSLARFEFGVPAHHRPRQRPPARLAVQARDGRGRGAEPGRPAGPPDRRGAVAGGHDRPCSSCAGASTPWSRSGSTRGRRRRAGRCAPSTCRRRASWWPSSAGATCCSPARRPCWSRTTRCWPSSTRTRPGRWPRSWVRPRPTRLLPGATRKGQAQTSAQAEGHHDRRRPPAGSAPRSPFGAQAAPAAYVATEAMVDGELLVGQPPPFPGLLDLVDHPPARQTELSPAGRLHARIICYSSG